MRLHAIQVIRELRRHGFEAYLAGGCVRDLLLGLEPADYDITTNATRFLADVFFISLSSFIGR
jgi:poly(A) polymerase